MNDRTQTRYALLENELLQIQATDSLRSDRYIEGIDLLGNDTLNFAREPEHLELVLRIMKEYGCSAGSGASRLLNGTTPLHLRAEAEFATWQDYEAGLMFSSGYVANVGTLSALLSKHDFVFSDALNHASIIDGIRLSGAAKYIYPHLDYDSLESMLDKACRNPGKKLIVSESLFSMDGDTADIKRLYELARRYDAFLMIDEAHAVGICGPESRGLIEHFGLTGQVDIAVFPCGKAIGTCGAMVCGNNLLRNYLVNHARSFIYTTAPTPFQAAAILAFLERLDEANIRSASVKKIAMEFKHQISERSNFSVKGEYHILPVIVGGNKETMELAASLQTQGYAIKAIRPPTVAEGTSRSRLSIKYGIPTIELERLIQLLS